jgi:hypothetical protein
MLKEELSESELKKELNDLIDAIRLELIKY